MHRVEAMNQTPPACPSSLPCRRHSHPPLKVRPRNPPIVVWLLDGTKNVILQMTVLSKDVPVPVGSMAERGTPTDGAAVEATLGDEPIAEATTGVEVEPPPKV